MKLHLVDGPQHGTTMYVEGEPQDRMFVPGIINSSRMLLQDDYLESNAFLMNHIHEYRMRYKTRADTYVYEYSGER